MIITVKSVIADNKYAYQDREHQRILLASESTNASS